MSLQTFENVGALIAATKPDDAQLCFNPEKIKNRVNAFKEGFPGRVSWAVKSNPHPEVVRAIVEAGINEFDVASKAEIEQMRYQCPSAILHFNHPVKPQAEIDFAYTTAGVKSFVVDCIEEVEKISGVFQKASKLDYSDITLLIRFWDPESKGSDNYDFNVKFGAIPKEAIEIMRMAKEKGFKTGLTFHPGSQNTNTEFYPSMMDKAQEIITEALGSELPETIRVNVGGGFPCHYPESKAPALSEYFKSISRGAGESRYELICEPGRALVADSISVLTRINLRRENDNRIYINDGFYGSFMELPFVDFMPPAQAYDESGVLMSSLQNDMKEFYIWGPTCDSLDHLPKKVRLPSKIRTGDYIEFGLMGAYTNASQTQFNGIKPADMVIVRNLSEWTTNSYTLS